MLDDASIDILADQKFQQTSGPFSMAPLLPGFYSLIKGLGETVISMWYLNFGAPFILLNKTSRLEALLIQFNRTCP
jgi:hypothetical protein